LILKKAILIFLTIVCTCSYSQNGAANSCGTKRPIFPAKKKYSSAVTNNLVTSIKQDTCINKKFSLVFYVTLDSNYHWGQGQSSTPPPFLTPSNIAAGVSALNAAFSRICISFMNCSTVVIPNYNYNTWTQNNFETIVTNSWYTPKTINVYVPADILIPSGAGGYTYFPGVGKDLIVITKQNMMGNPGELVHQMGHFFGLPDTWDEIGSPVSPGPPAGIASYEYVSRTNCYTNGDGFCDTEADCYWAVVPPGPHNTIMSNTVSPCTYVWYGVQDGHGDYYTPPSDNYMSDYLCRCRFTQEQLNFMAHTIITTRNYLH
jgi:hypothetical protein